MKFIYIVNAEMPTKKAYGVQVAKMCEAFARSGIELDMIVPWRYGTKGDPYEYYGIKRNFRMIRLCSIDLIGIIPYFGYWIQAISFVTRVLVYSLFMSRKDTLVYTREYLIVPWCRLLGFRVVYESHRILAKERTFFALARYANWIVTNSEGVAEEFRKRDFPRVLAQQNGVTLEEFFIKQEKDELRRALTLSSDAHIAMYTGHLYDWKGVDTVVEAAVQMPEVQFVFVGGTDEDVARYRAQAIKETLHNVQFVGHVPKVKIPQYVTAADVLLLPNIPVSVESSHYTSPMKLFEYMASGVPVVASDLPSIREILNEENSVLVAPGDAPALREAIQGLRGNHKKSMSIAAQAKKDVQEYAWEKRAKRILSFVGVAT